MIPQDQTSEQVQIANLKFALAQIVSTHELASRYPEHGKELFENALENGHDELHKEYVHDYDDNGICYTKKGKPPINHRPETTFISELTDLINRHNIENGSNTPDHVLAEFLRQVIDAWDYGTKARDKWYGVVLQPGGSHFTNDGNKA